MCAFVDLRTKYVTVNLLIKNIFTRVKVRRLQVLHREELFSIRQSYTCLLAPPKGEESLGYLTHVYSVNTNIYTDTNLHFIL